jgi:hypothetical protein
MQKRFIQNTERDNLEDTDIGKKIVLKYAQTWGVNVWTEVIIAHIWNQW